MKQIIAHVDMDCFFAAVEQKLNPTLYDKPVIVGAMPGSKRGVVCTANYNARKYGIKSAMPIAKAIKLCPNAVLIPPWKTKYSKFSKIVMKTLSKFTNKMEQMSCDEAYLDITEFAFEKNSLYDAALAIKDAVYYATGLSCSIGIAESKYIAKIASDYNKPNGITIVKEPYNFIKNMSVKKISGIGKIMQRDLELLNIETIEELANAETKRLTPLFGDNIIHFQKIAKGLDDTGITENRYVAKSISKETTFDEDILLEDCEHYIENLSNTIVKQLDEFCYRTIGIKIKYNNFETITRTFTIENPAKDINNVINTSKKLLFNVIKQNNSSNKISNKVRLFGVKIENLCVLKESQNALAAYC